MIIPKAQGKYHTIGECHVGCSEAAFLQKVSFIFEERKLGLTIVFVQGMVRPLATNADAWRLDHVIALPVKATNLDEVATIGSIVSDKLSDRPQRLGGVNDEI